MLSRNQYGARAPRYATAGTPVPGLRVPYGAGPGGAPISVKTLGDLWTATIGQLFKGGTTTPPAPTTSDGTTQPPVVDATDPLATGVPSADGSESDGPSGDFSGPPQRFIDTGADTWTLNM